MKYISTIINNKYMQIGGFGHIFYDILSSYIIAHLFGLKFVYSPIVSLGFNHHSGKNFGDRSDDINWDTFLKFYENETRIEELKNINKVKINICDAFKTMDINKLKNFIDSHPDNTLFILSNNNRIYINELYNYNRKVYNIVFNNLKKKLMHLKTKKNKITTISIHIRRGDWDWQPLSYNVEFLKLLKKKEYNINIFSIGTQNQLEEIKNKFKNFKNITFYFNTDIFDTFKKIYNSDIILAGHSNFPKIISLFSDNIIIYLPYNDGIINALGGFKKFKKFYLGKYPELFDEKKRIETDIYCKKNRDKIIKFL